MTVHWGTLTGWHRGKTTWTGSGVVGRLTRAAGTAPLARLLSSLSVFGMRALVVQLLDDIWMGLGGLLLPVLCLLISLYTNMSRSRKSLFLSPAAALSGLKSAAWDMPLLFATVAVE